MPQWTVAKAQKNKGSSEDSVDSAFSSSYAYNTRQNGEQIVLSHMGRYEANFAAA
jgi:hypothetical protein